MQLSHVDDQHTLLQVNCMAATINIKEKMCTIYIYISVSNILKV